MPGPTPFILSDIFTDKEIPPVDRHKKFRWGYLKIGIKMNGGRTVKTEEMEDKQERALLFIRAYKEAEGISPTVREVGAYLGVSSTSITHEILKGLKARGRISMKKGCPRSITIVQGKELI